jgi:hypothetical protein
VRREPLRKSLIGAWKIQKQDPVGILLPAGGILFLQIAASVVFRGWYAEMQWSYQVLLLLSLYLGQFLLMTPLRAAIIGAGSAVMGKEVLSSLQTPALLFVHFVIAVFQTVLVAIIITPTLLLTGLIASQGWFATSTIVLALGTLAATAVAFFVRVFFAYAPFEAIVNGRDGGRALYYGFVGKDLIGVTLLMLTGDFLLAIGVLFCAVGALPAYAIGDLALLHRWSNPIIDEDNDESGQ